MAGRMVARELWPTGGYPALPVLRESTTWPWRFTLMDQRRPLVSTLLLMGCHPAPRCPTLTKIVHPSRLNGWCRLMCGLRSQLPAG